MDEIKFLLETVLALSLANTFAFVIALTLLVCDYYGKKRGEK